MNSLWHDLKFLNLTKNRLDISDYLRDTEGLNDCYLNGVSKLVADRKILNVHLSPISHNRKLFVFQRSLELDIQTIICCIARNTQAQDGIN